LLARGDDVVIMHRGKGTPFGTLDVVYPL
jgi:hypothetical protein